MNTSSVSSNIVYCGRNVSTIVSVLASTALLVMALVAVGGLGLGLVPAAALPTSTFGWVAVGLGGGGFALQLLSEKNPKGKKFTIILSALIATAFVTVGVLGGLRLMTAQQLAWGILGIAIAKAASTVCCTPCLILEDVYSQRQIDKLEDMNLWDYYVKEYPFSKIKDWLNLKI